MPEWLVDNSAAFILKDLDCIANKSFSTERNFEMTYRLSVLNTWLDNFLNKRLIICAERAFQFHSRVNLINMALKAGYSVDIYARGNQKFF